MGDQLDAVVREVVEQLAARHESRSNLWEGLDTVLGRTGSSKAEVCDAVAKVLAIGFADRILTFDFCDDLVNAAFAWITEDLVNHPDPLADWPELFMRIFEAFEEGEFVHPGDSAEIDSAEKYARAKISAAIRDLWHD